MSLADPAATAIHARVERWALDEAPLPGQLVHEIMDWLYREDRFCRGSLAVCGKEVGPSRLRLPTLMVSNTADEIAPPASTVPFARAMLAGAARVIEFPGETGVGLQHLAILVGRQAYARIWPQIIRWIKASADLAASRQWLSSGAEEGGTTLMQVKCARSTGGYGDSRRTQDRSECHGNPTRTD